MTPRDNGTLPEDERQSRAAARTAQLRILATTDVHMQLLGFDYVSDQPGRNGGFASLATLIKEARAEAAEQSQGCLLLDNGDILQGNAMGDLLAQDVEGLAHPVPAALNALGYDAVGVGNHDLDYGLPYLQSIARQLQMPVISTNLETTQLPPLQNATIVTCQVPAGQNQPTCELNIGILSVLPAQTAIWNRYVLGDIAQVSRPEHSLAKAVRLVRARGADIVVLLAHLGIDEPTTARKDRESAVCMAEIPGIDAIITGHTHRRFPGNDHQRQQGVDIDAGTLANRPAIMPGFAASDLAVLELTVARGTSDIWHVTDHKSTLRRNDANVPSDSHIQTLCHPAHQKTRRALAAKVGETDKPLQNYFSLVIPTTTCAFTAKAKATVIARTPMPADLRELPLLATASAHTAGGRGGSDHYLHIPKGDVLQRHLAGLSPYANQVTAIKVSGADLRSWLETTAKVFQKLTPENPDQLLLDPAVPAFNFDTIFGLTYQIDPTQPAGARISDIRYGGKLVAPAQSFLLATNEFRAAGGGGCIAPQAKNTILSSGLETKHALAVVLRQPDPFTTTYRTPWRFCSSARVQAVFETAPEALAFLYDIAHLSPEPLGQNARGFERIRLTL